MDPKTVSSYFIGYFERSRGYKFYDPTLKKIFETGNAVFFKDVEFKGRNNIRDIGFEEEESLTQSSIELTSLGDVQVSIPVIVQETIPNIHMNNFELPLIQEEVILPIVETQQPQIQEQVPLRRSTRERRSAISDDFIIFLQEHEENYGTNEDDPITFTQAINCSNSQKWIEAMNEEYKSMQDNK